MNKKQWKAEYSIWRAFLSPPSWMMNNNDVCMKIASVKYKKMKEGAHRSMVGAKFNSFGIESYTDINTGGKVAMQLNLQMTREACEAKRINDRKG